MEEDDATLYRVLDLEEVRQVIFFFIDLDSVPQPTCFHSRFYRSHWDILAANLLVAILDYFNGSIMPRGF